jgi:glycerol kinase
VPETTALGAACLAGITSGFWNGIEEVKKRWQYEKVFEPAMKPEKRERLVAGWHKAVSRSRGWIDP